MVEAQAETQSGLLRNSVIYGSLTLVVYALSTLKTIIVARWLGTSPEMDAFTVATVIPNLAGALVSSTTAGALVPVFVRASRDGQAVRATVFRSALILFTLVCVAISVLMAVFSEPISHLVAARFDHYQLRTTARMLRWASGLVVSTGVYAFCSAELLSRKRFGLIGIAPAASTFISLLAILLFHNLGVGVLVWSLVAGTTVQALLPAIPSWRAARGGRLFAWRNADVRRTLTSQIPLLGAASIGVANTFIDQMFSARLPAGSVSALNYAASMNACVMQVVVMTLGWVALPELSALFALRKIEALRHRIRYCLVVGVVIAAPASATVVVFGQSVVQLILQHGRFHSDSTQLVFLGWLGYSLGLVPVAIGMILVRLINAIGKNSLLFYISLLLLAANAVLDFVFMQLWGVFGISLSTSVVYCVATVIFLPVMGGTIGRVLDTRTVRLMLSAVAGTVLSCAPIVLLRILFPTSPLAAALQFVLFLSLLLIAFSAMKLVRWRWGDPCSPVPVALALASEENLYATCRNGSSRIYN